MILFNQVAKRDFKTMYGILIKKGDEVVYHDSGLLVRTSHLDDGCKSIFPINLTQFISTMPLNNDAIVETLGRQNQ